MSLLEDPSRVFLTSPFVRLEVEPKAIYYKKHLERSFYEKFFKTAVWYRELDKIEEGAQTEASRSGLAAIDALHLAAAHLSLADEFITTGKPNKPIHRSSLVKVIYLFS